MRNATFLDTNKGTGMDLRPVFDIKHRRPRMLIIGVILVLSLLAFEMFNFDTTRYALESLIGDIRFIGLGWATILAIAFCAIDFAGLARLLTPGGGPGAPKEFWYLTGAWLLGATMNAVMTWWAVSLTLLEHDLGNEVLNREQLLSIVPIFIAALVWLTRILFIGALTLAGERILQKHNADRVNQGYRLNSREIRSRNKRTNGRKSKSRTRPRTTQPIDLSQPPQRYSSGNHAPMNEPVAESIGAQLQYNGVGNATQE